MQKLNKMQDIARYRSSKETYLKLALYFIDS